MEEQKKNPELRFEGFKEDWEEVELGKLAYIVRGASPRPIHDPKWFNEKSEIGWLRISDVTKQNGEIHFLEQRISLAGQEKTRVLHSPHLLLSIAASVGKPVINYVKTGVHDGFLIFQSPSFDISFMFSCLKMFEFEWQKYGQPGSQVNLNSDIVKNHLISLPKPEEQKQIGSFFKNIDELITKHQMKQNRLVTLKKSMLEKMFPKEGEIVPEIRFKGFEGDWEKKKLNQIATYQSSSLTVGDALQNGKYELYDANTIIGYTNEETLTEDYITIIKDGSGVGRLRVLPKKTGFIATLGAILPNKGIDLTFLLCYLSNTDFNSHIIGATIPHVYFSSYGEVVYYVPTTEEQLKIGKYFQNIDTLITNHLEQLQKLKNFKQSLYEKMFI